MSRIVGERCSSQASATWMREMPRRAATWSSAPDCRSRNPPSGEEWHERDALFRALVDQGVVGADGEVVEVLHRDDRGDRLGRGNLLHADVTHAQVPEVVGHGLNEFVAV